MGSVRAGFVEVFERVVTALVPRVFARFLFDELVDSLCCEGMSRPLFARGNGFKPFPRIDSMDHEVQVVAELVSALDYFPHHKLAITLGAERLRDVEPEQLMFVTTEV